MSEEFGFDPQIGLTRRELRARQRQEESMGLDSTIESDAPTISEPPVISSPANDVSSSTIAETPAGGFVSSFGRDFKFVAPELDDSQLDNERLAADEEKPDAFNPPYRYVPGGASATANQNPISDSSTNNLSEPVPAPPVVTSQFSQFVPPISSFATSNTPTQAPSMRQESPQFSEPIENSEASPNEASAISEISSEDVDDGLFRIPTSLTGEVATASIVIDNPTNPLDIIATATSNTGAIPAIKTGSIEIQNPEAPRPSLTVAGPIAAVPSTDTASTAIITPLKSQTIALSGELGHQRGVRFKPVDTQKYWVLGIGVLMVVVGAGFLASFLLGYVK